jgi:hypothetical protein
MELESAIPNNFAPKGAIASATFLVPYTENFLNSSFNSGQYRRHG